MNKLMTIFAILVIGSTTLAQNSTYNCSLDVDRTKQLLLPDNTVENESSFLMSAAIAVDSCSDLAKQRNFRGLSTSIASMRAKCDASARQGMSDLYHGHCYLKLADLASFILGQ